MQFPVVIDWQLFSNLHHKATPEKDAQVYIWLDQVGKLVIYRYSTCVTDAALRRKGSRPYLDFMVVEMTSVFIKGIHYKYSVCGLQHQKKFCSFSSDSAISEAFHILWHSFGCVHLVKRAFPGRRDFTRKWLFAVACCILDFLLLPLGISKTLRNISS